MESLVEYCKQQFSDEIDYKFSLANVACWMLCITSIYGFYTLKEETLIGAFNKITVKLFLSMEEGIVAELTITQLLGSLLFVVAVVWLSRRITEFLFYLFTLREDFNGYAGDVESKYRVEIKNNAAAAKILGEEASKVLPAKRKLFKLQQGLSEVILSLGFCSMLGLSFNSQNLIVLVVCVATFVVLNWKAFNYYVSEVFPYYAAQRICAGHKAEFGDGYK